MDVAIGNVIEKGIEKCNKTEEFVFPYYFVTNTNIPTEKEISEIIQKIKK